MALLEFSDRGLYCAAGDFYIDPWRPVAHAVITHAHSDHARSGHQHYLCHHLTKPLLQLRLGNHSYESIEWSEPVYRNGVKISLHPAGHIIGSSQIRLEYKGEVWVVSGDYKTENDGLSGAFEPVNCHTFITESTFGLPVYKWQPQQFLFQQMQQWVEANSNQGICSVIFAYSLGKAQRVLQAVAPVTNNIFVHGAVWNTQQALQKSGIVLPTVQRVSDAVNKEAFKGAVVIAPSSAQDSPWLKRFQPYKIAVCSGWMQVRGNARRQNVDAGFALSDHADWNGLLAAVKATGAEKVFVTHGFQSVFSRYLNENGIAAAEVKTEYGGEEGAQEEDNSNAVNITTE
ncbi:ligase-associated DNA damage response exonuclease [Lacibacter sp. MH-610]|uniref:ligase-associated DNA damage response exonuclease n=1 Tax=Lacibacter sp. MH-610 TaxID=3020883 RepID=UPI00389263BA